MGFYHVIKWYSCWKWQEVPLANLIEFVVIDIFSERSDSFKHLWLNPSPWPAVAARLDKGPKLLWLSYWQIWFITANGERFQKKLQSIKIFGESENYWEDSFKRLLMSVVPRRAQMLTSEVYFWFHFNLIFMVLRNIEWAEIKFDIFDQANVYFKMVYATSDLIHLKIYIVQCYELSTARSRTLFNNTL